MKTFIKPPILSTAFAESKRTEKKRFVHILSNTHRKTGMWLLVVLILAIVLSGCVIGKQDMPSQTSHEMEYTDLDAAMGAFLLADNQETYLQGECAGEGHIILGTEKSNGKNKAYVLTMYGTYGFLNDAFVKISGSGCIPAVVTFSDKDGTYQVESIEYPMDGAYYVKSIQENFPEIYWDRVLEIKPEDEQNVKQQEKAYAQAYLKRINRNAEICEYADLNVNLLTDLGVSVEVSNKLVESEILSDYPMFVGTQEKLENNTRYVYELRYDAAQKQIIYTKYKYGEPQNPTEKFVYDDKSVLIENVSTPA